MITFHLDRENNRHIHHQSASVRDERTMYLYRSVHVYERINAYVHKCTQVSHIGDSCRDVFRSDQILSERSCMLSYLNGAMHEILTDRSLSIVALERRKKSIRTDLKSFDYYEFLDNDTHNE